MIPCIFCDYYCGILGYYSKHYLFKKYFLRVDSPSKWPFSHAIPIPQYMVFFEKLIKPTPITTQKNRRAPAKTTT